MNDQENYGGTCYNSTGTTKITCPAQPTYSPYPSPSPTGSYTPTACPSGYYWETLANMCKPIGYTPMPSCPSGQWWDYANNYCRTTCSSTEFWDPAVSRCVPMATYSPSPGTTYTYTPYPSCPSGQWWDTATSSCKSITSTGYCGNYFCDSGETSTSCPADCGGTYSPYPTSTYTYTPYPTSTYTYTPPPSCPSGQYWDMATNSCMSSTTTTYTPAPTVDPSASCTSSGGTWNGSMCVYPSPSPSPTTSLYNPYMVAHCQHLGRAWNGKICEANGLFVRFFEGSGVANILRLFYIIP